MVSRRFLIRGTRGSGPPPDLAFREVAYSDGDGLLHVGRPDGTARSFGAAGETGPQGPQGPQGETGPAGPAGPIIAPIVIPLTPINGYLPYAASWANELRVFPGLGMALLRFGVSSSAPVAGAPIVQWAGYAPPDGQVYVPTAISSQGGLRNPDQILLLIGSTLQFAAVDPTPLDYLVGSVWFFYA